MTTGERIKALRISLGMSQEELGALIGVKKAAINKYETGIVVNLKQSIIAKLADALQTTPTYLMGWEEPQPVSDDDIKFALFGGADGITDEQFEEVKKFSKFIKERDKEKNKD